MYAFIYVVNDMLPLQAMGFLPLFCLYLPFDFAKVSSAIQLRVSLEKQNMSAMLYTSYSIK